MATRAERLTYTAAQTARIAFYGAHYLAARVMARDAFNAIDGLKHKIPSPMELFRSMQALFREDWKNVEKGLYPMPVDLARDVARATASLRFWSDIPKVTRRQKARHHSEAAEKGEGLPRYYRQNFHFQTDGYLSHHSAKLYDFQVEALFAGTADAMRRRVYVPIAAHLADKKPGRMTLLDIGAGTGRFLSFVKSVQPDLKAVALDLSEPYLDEARTALARYDNVEFIEGAAESIPLPDKSVDMVASIYLFHELPPKIRAAVAGEIARVLKPGGIFVMGDTIQYGDLPEFDGLIEAFPRLLHEPYYAGYAKSDLKALFEPAGLKWTAQDFAYLTKVTTFTKPGARRRKNG
jgi:ubiquinone/menaquinone biosynthesis C-methylase UbiE